MKKAAQRIAVVLFNLGGPDGPEAVQPFLRNLFADKAIIALPTPFRQLLAQVISVTRAKVARANYAHMGGGSPILAHTLDQGHALTVELTERFPEADVRVFVAMRHWHPFTAEAASEVAEFAPDQVVLAPLYPQFSTTTTGSSFAAWRKAYHGSGEVHSLCCWFENEGLIDTHVARIIETWEGSGRPNVRLLFSAHGLPKSVVAKGDPYQWQIEATCAAIAQRLGSTWDWRLCYQSRVGPMQWLGPSTPEAIAEAARDGVGVLIDPVAFVSEHVETLVELDRDYADLARDLGMTTYLRVPVVGLGPVFIAGLAGAVERALQVKGLNPEGRACPGTFAKCPWRLGGIHGC